MTNELYYFNSECDETLENKLFTIHQLYEVYRDVFKKELIKMGDAETTFESWLNDNLKMDSIVLIDENPITIPKRYTQTYVSCLPIELERLITDKVRNNYGYLIEDDFYTMLDNVLCEKVTNITDTINIEFVHEI